MSLLQCTYLIRYSGTTCVTTCTIRYYHCTCIMYLWVPTYSCYIVILSAFTKLYQFAYIFHQRQRADLRPAGWGKSGHERFDIQTILSSSQGVIVFSVHVTAVLLQPCYGFMSLYQRVISVYQHS